MSLVSASSSRKSGVLFKNRCTLARHSQHQQVENLEVFLTGKGPNPSAWADNGRQERMPTAEPAQHGPLTQCDARAPMAVCTDLNEYEKTAP